MEQVISKWVLGHKVTMYPTTGDYDLALGETPAMVQGPPPHSHSHYKESFLIVQGEMQFMVNGETRVIKAGEAIDIPPDTVHTFGNVSDAPCQWVNIHSPKGFRKFFEHVGVLAEEEASRERSVQPEIVKEVLQVADRYDMKIYL